MAIRKLKKKNKQKKNKKLEHIEYNIFLKLTCVLTSVTICITSIIISRFVYKH